MRIALLGGTGFVGQALLRRLAGNEHEVRALARDPSRLVAEGVEVVAGSLEELPAALFAHEPEVVIHFATKQVDQDGRGFQATNVAGTERLLAALPASARVVLYGSSLSVYGQGPQRGEAEQALAIRPATALARSRAAAEERILAWAQERSASAHCLRPRFVLGRGDRFTLPGLRRLTAQGRTLGSGEQRFSVIDVDDYAALILALAQEALAADEPRQGGLHVGYQRPLSLAELQSALAEGFDLAPPRRRLRLPITAANALAALPLGGLSKQAVKFQLVGQDHYVSVERLRGLVGDTIVARDPREVTVAAIEWLKEHGE